jgi:signal peptidase I
MNLQPSAKSRPSLPGLQLLKSFWSEYRSLLVFIALMLVFRSTLADWNDVPTGSMNPTIVEGDRILINKMAYDLRLPFTTYSLVKLDDPQRGDIVVFESAVADKRLVKRVIGLPGDKVAMRDNRLWINGQPLEYRLLQQQADAVDYEEKLGELSYSIRINPNAHSFSGFEEVQVPAGHYLMLGDNRDNSADSRFIGFVPRDEIIGRSRQLVLSLNYDNYFLPRSDRFWQPL